MQLKQIPRDALLKPLQAVSGIVERRQTLPILANVLLEQKDGRLFVTTQGGALRIVKNGSLLPTPFLSLWVQHSRTTQLSALEALHGDEDWQALEQFIQRYGHDLFHARFMTLGNLRGILHRGIGAWLEQMRRDPDSGESPALIADLDEPGATKVVAAGGAGGRGNVHFKSSSRQAPDHAEPGLPGVEKAVTLDLKLIADVGLVGPPNAGKSSLLESLTAATPTVAAYPFTTLDPELGVMDEGERRLVLADIPGLLEGASRGVGLGLRFLRHVERTRVLAYIVDGAADDAGDPGERTFRIPGHRASHQPEGGTRKSGFDVGEHDRRRPRR